MNFVHYYDRYVNSPCQERANERRSRGNID